MRECISIHIGQAGIQTGQQTRFEFLASKSLAFRDPLLWLDLVAEGKTPETAGVVELALWRHPQGCLQGMEHLSRFDVRGLGRTCSLVDDGREERKNNPKMKHDKRPTETLVSKMQSFILCLSLIHI